MNLRPVAFSHACSVQPLSHCQGEVQQPGEKYFQALRKRFEAVSHRVGALQRLERRLLVEGEPTLREQFLSALKAHAGDRESPC